MTVGAAVEPGNGLAEILDRQRAAFLRDGPPTAAQRRSDLMKLKNGLRQHREDFIAAIDADFGHRSRHETALFDLATVVEGIDYLHRNLRSWMRPERRRVAMHFFPASNRVLYQPLGVVGIISPWNYPIALSLMPLATALAAGNRVMVKPSELTPRTSNLMKAVLAEFFAEDQVAVATGDRNVGIEFSHLPFDHLLFTGGTSVGRSVLKAASDNLVPVTLELGGKSPAIVDRTSALRTAARRIAYGKLANGGQTCIAPDYVLVPEHATSAFIAAYEKEVARLYPNVASNPDYTSIINDHHYARLTNLLDNARAKGARVIQIGGSAEPACKTHARTMMPSVLLDVTDEMDVMRDEIFGPILPIVPYCSLEEAVDYVNSRPRPLALYYFGAEGRAKDMVLERTTSGGISINETILHYAQNDIPFGGVGPSGMGAYHGQEGFKSLSHAKGVFKQARYNLADAARPPFGRLFDRLVKILMR